MGRCGSFNGTMKLGGFAEQNGSTELIRLPQCVYARFSSVLLITFCLSSMKCCSLQLSPGILKMTAATVAEDV